MSDTARMLGNVELFADVPLEVREQMVARGSTRSLPAGATIVTQGQEDAGLQMITEGEARVIVHGNHVRTLGVGDFFGDISLIDNRPRSATIEAGDAGCRTFAVSPLVFWEIVEANTAVARVVMKALAHRVRGAEQALSETRVELAEARGEQS
ncbi:MAG: cyclic nucleotide-binding domain-containing protein [Candidatus Nanopelagicales bacterium]